MIAPTSFFADYGCHVRILEEARILQKLGQQVTIVTYRNGSDVPGLDIQRTLSIPWRRNVEVGSSRHKIILDALLGLKTMELLARRKFDVIHAHLHEGALIGLVLRRLFGLPLVFDFQGSMTAEMTDHHFLKPGSIFFDPLLRLETRIARSAPIILTSSDYAASLLCNQFGCQPERVRSLPDCVDADAFRPAASYDPAELVALRQALGIPSGRKLIVYLGLLAEYQGTGLLLESLQHVVRDHDDAHLLLMGFPSVELYRQRALELGVGAHVTFTGRVPYSQAPMYLALGDVGVAPKLSLTEGSGKLLNYMAVALPVVAFDTPAAREYLGADGSLAAPGDVGGLARCLSAALFPADGAGGPVLRRGERLRQRAVESFSWRAAGNQIVTTYGELRGDRLPERLPQHSWAASGK